MLKTLSSWDWSVIISASTFMFVVLTFRKANKIVGKVYCSKIEDNKLQVFVVNVNNKSGKFFYSGMFCRKHRIWGCSKRVEDKKLSDYNIGAIQIVAPGDAKEMKIKSLETMNDNYADEYKFYRMAVKNLKGKEFKSKWIQFKKTTED
ncbi:MULTISPECIES: hypothetical protein [Companilactobacillus]|uniref:hypothetical protein n=1 Tax=Companilactobacillus TaxID=2767879 RepID=UPI0011BEC434|nr:hypothetical protein [Companilactobacillus nantensis]